jgi:hypothetical protein
MIDLLSVNNIDFYRSPGITSATDAAGTGVDVSEYQGDLMLVLSSGGAVIGDAPLNASVLQCVVQESDELSANYTNTAFAFTNASNTGAQEAIRVPSREVKKYIRVLPTVTGVNASYTLSVVGFGQPQYAD